MLPCLWLQVDSVKVRPYPLGTQPPRHIIILPAKRMQGQCNNIKPLLFYLDGSSAILSLVGTLWTHTAIFSSTNIFHIACTRLQWSNDLAVPARTCKPLCCKDRVMLAHLSGRLPPHPYCRSKSRCCDKTATRQRCSRLCSNSATHAVQAHAHSHMLPRAILRSSSPMICPSSRGLNLAIISGGTGISVK